MKKSFLVLLFLLMTSLSLASNYYANLNGSATNGGGTWATAIRLDSFPWWFLQPGDIVNIDGGSSGSEIVYEVTLPLDYYNVSGSASGGYVTIRKGIDAGHNGKVILDGYVGGYPPDDYNIDMDYCSYIKIEGLTIRDAAKDNISALNVSNCIIYNCIILDAEWDNINFNEAVDCTVSTCSLHITGVKPSGAASTWSANGINATNCSRLLIENNTITCDVHDNGVGHQIDLIKIGGFKNISTSNQDGHVIRSNTLVNSNEYDPGHDDCIQVYTDCDTKLYRGDANYPNILQIYRNWIQTTQNQDWNHPDDPDLVDETNAGIIIAGDYIDYVKDIGQNIKIEVWSNIFKGYWGKNSVSITNMQPQYIAIFNNTFYTEKNNSPVFCMYNNINWVTYSNAVTIDNFMLLNNIFYTPEATSEPNVQFGYRKTDGTIDAPVKFGTNVIIDDNCYYEAMNPNNTYTKRFYTHNHIATGTCRGSLDNISYSLTNWKSTFSIDTYSIELNPLFTSTSTFLLDNTLNDHSPCLNNGEELPSPYDTGSYISAYDGTERPLGIIDMGANEQLEGDWSPPKNISLKGSLNAYPNPFNPFTTIEYYILKDGFVSLKIFNILGKEVVTLINENKIKGKYNVVFNGESLSSGIYFYLLNSEGYSEIKKLILLK